jgi:hypothetical protein
MRVYLDCCTKKTNLIVRSVLLGSPQCMARVVFKKERERLDFALHVIACDAGGWIFGSGA